MTWLTSHVTFLLRALCRRAAGKPAHAEIAAMRQHYLELEPVDELVVFHTRLALTMIDLTGDLQQPDAASIASQIGHHIRTAGDGYAARDLLTHQACRTVLTDAHERTLRAIVEAAGLSTGAIPEPLIGSQADVLLACDFIETATLNGQRQYILAVIEHATRRVRVLGTTAHPSASWVIQAIRNLVMDLEDAGCRARFLIRDRDGKFPALMEEILADAGIQTVLTGIRLPRMNSIMGRWVQSCRRELLDRCLLWNERHLRHALREYERFYNQHRAHQALDQAAPLRAVPDPITDPERIIDLNVCRQDRLG
ncbi:integrase core domain-containing protein [Nonomuraea sp. NPDC003707]